MCRQNRVGVRLRKADVLHRACLNQFLDRTRDIVNRRIRVNSRRNGLLVKQLSRMISKGCAARWL